MTPQRALAGFIAKFTPQVAAVADEALAKLRARLPGAVELVSDNSHALAIGFAPAEKASEVIFSIALSPRGVSLFFLQGAKLEDPKHLLRGDGKTARHLVLEDASDLEMPGVRALITAALETAKRPIDPKNANRIVIKSVSKKQRPRRPRGEAARPAKKAHPRPRAAGRRPK